jgi:threonine dehydrogenase-like Zn-dependent dehydrogenase
MLVEMLAIGMCGTDREILAGKYGWAPPGCSYLIIGHESLGRVLEAPPGSGFSAGDLVVGVVRHPDPVPCPSCAAGEFDMCQNGQYREHGIKALHGFATERYELDPRFAVVLDKELADVGVLLEPTSIVVKAWEHALRIGGRAHFSPRRVLVTGAGPIGLLTTLIGVQYGLEIHVLDRVKEGPKPELVTALGATYHASQPSIQALRSSFDMIFECTGAPQLVLSVIDWVGPGGVVALVGVSSPGRTLPIDLGLLNRDLVLDNIAVFGSVSANMRHYAGAATALLRAERERPKWLRRIITRRLPLSRFTEALMRQPDDIKIVLEGPGVNT